MADKQILSYIKSQLERGVKIEDISDALLKAGWPEADVKEAIQSSATPAEIPSVPQEQSAPAVATSPVSEPVNLPAVADPSAIVTSPQPSQPTVSPESQKKSVDFPAISAKPSPVDSASPVSSATSNDSLQIPTEPEASSPEIVSINNQESEQKAKAPVSHNNIPLIAGLIALIIAVIAAGYWYIKSNEEPAVVPSETQNQENQPASTTSTKNESNNVVQVPVEDSDITGAKEAFQLIREAHIAKDVASERQYLSAQTLATVASSSEWQPVWYKDLVVIDAEKEADTVILSIASIQENGSSSTAKMVFIQEDGKWKMGIAETLQKTSSENVPDVATSTSATASSTKK
ncbi:MAG: hypothetical protein NUV53_02475 [Patescibacteria group bacterium]|nr:hypothetical protein [Patescibacteria group bacterium]